MAGLSYRGYRGTVEYSKEGSCLFGKTVGIRSLLSYEGATEEELERGFQNVVDAYLSDRVDRDMGPFQENA